MFTFIRVKVCWMEMFGTVGGCLGTEIVWFFKVIDGVTKGCQVILLFFLSCYCRMRYTWSQLGHEKRPSIAQ